MVSGGVICVLCVGFVMNKSKFFGDFDVDGQFDGVRSDFCCETLAGDGGIDSVYLFGCI